MKKSVIKLFCWMIILALTTASIACSNAHHKKKCQDCPEWTYHKEAKAIQDRM